MGDDLSTGAKIGIGLVILCFLIAIVLSLLMVVKNITNSGANQMEGGLNQMMSTTYDDYDQKIVTGTKVKSAIKLFASEPIGIVIDSGYNGKSEFGQHVYNYGRLLDKVGEQTVPTTPSNFSGDTGGKTWGDLYKIPTISETAKFNTDGVSIKGEARTTSDFNLNSRPISASGKDTYVRDNGKYNSFLIKDSTDTIIGIYFQLAT